MSMLAWFRNSVNPIWTPHQFSLFGWLFLIRRYLALRHRPLPEAVFKHIVTVTFRDTVKLFGAFWNYNVISTFTVYTIIYIYIYMYNSQVWCHPELRQGFFHLGLQQEAKHRHFFCQQGCPTYSLRMVWVYPALRSALLSEIQIGRETSQKKYASFG